METIEERALREVRVEFVRRLNVNDYVLDFIQQEGELSDLACEMIRSAPSRPEQASALIDWVIQKAIIPTFIKGLQCNNSHKHLASLLTTKIQSLQAENSVKTKCSKSSVSATGFDFSFDSDFSFASSSRINIIDGPRTDSVQRDTVDPDDTKVMSLWSGSVETDGGGGNNSQCVVAPLNKNRFHIKGTNPWRGERLTLRQAAGNDHRGEGKLATAATNQSVNSDNDEDKDDEEDRSDNAKIYEQPRKVDIMNAKKKTLTKIHYHLKLLSHDGKKAEFDAFVSSKKKTYFYDADIMFTLLDAEVESRRLVYDTGLHKGDIFDEMEKCIKSSSHPVANTMTFLARKGSARTMKESLEVGLEMLEEARGLSEHIQPCKDTGMVLYILINILFQMYERNPATDIKDKIIRKIDEAINVHFAEGPVTLREDYTRMLYLKMVFCYLGIGLFGNTIEQCVVSKEDLKSAETCLQIIDSSRAKFDSRRRMFYFMAKSVLHRKRGDHAGALEFAETAKRKAKKCGFKKELGPILELTGDLRSELADKDSQDIEARGKEIEKELHALDSEMNLVSRTLDKPCNQWGNETVGDTAENITDSSKDFRNKNRLEVGGTAEMLLFLIVALLFAICSVLIYVVMAK